MRRLDGDDRPHEQAQQGDDADALDADRLELDRRGLCKHTPLLRWAQRGGHEGEIAADVVEDAHAFPTKVRRAKGR